MERGRRLEIGARSLCRARRLALEEQRFLIMRPFTRRGPVWQVREAQHPPADLVSARLIKTFGSVAMPGYSHFNAITPVSTSALGVVS